MSTGERQREVLDLVGHSLGVEVRHSPEFPWLRNRHLERDFGEYFPAIAEIFRTLGGDEATLASKRSLSLKPDGYICAPYNCLFEFDEFQHFSSARERTLLLLPANLPLGYSRAHYLELCRVHREDADSYRHAKRTPEFHFAGGRTAQRAYFDCFRDLLPTLHGLRPTIRLAEFDVQSISSERPESIAKLAEMVRGRLAYGP